LIDAILRDSECSKLLIPKTIQGSHTVRLYQRYDFMQMRWAYSYQLLAIYFFAFISEGGFCGCVVLSYEGSILIEEQFWSFLKFGTTLFLIWRP